MGQSYGAKAWDRFERYPPVLCRLLARVPKGRPLTTAEISERSGLSRCYVEAISQQTDWKDIPIPSARAFMTACGTDLLDRQDCKRIWAYLRTQHTNTKRKWNHLRKDPAWDEYYRPLLQRFLNYLIQRKGRK